AIVQGIILVGGFALGLVGLAWLEERRKKRVESTGVDALEVATMIAIGIGLHNFAEGLAIGQSFSGGNAALGTLLVVGFALHNATEGFGIAGPLVGRDISWTRLLVLGLIGGVPTAIGSFVGGIWVNPSLELLFLSVAVGSLVYVTRELFRLRFPQLGAVGATAALAFGFFLGFGTELVVGVAQSKAAANSSNTKSTATLRFANKQVDPPSITLARGQAFTIQNDGNVPLVFEGNGLFVGEVVAPASGSITVTASGNEGKYALVDERGQSGTGTIVVQPGGAIEPLTDEVNAVGALMILEGHVRTSKALHDRGTKNEGPNPALDLKRTSKHAGHPQHELLMGNEPDALVLQKLLRDHGVFDSVNNALTEYVAVAGKSDVPQADIDSKYQAVITTTEQACKAIAGTAYDKPDFRIRAARFVLETAASEYATATEGDKIEIVEAGTPGKDNLIEFQDARGFLQAMRETFMTGNAAIHVNADGQAALDKLQNDILKSLEPPDLNRPVPAAEFRSLTERVGSALIP
ncbi:MAG TPA: ZIP family metal transporter, partial [Pyrinomonadaceae bacterium]|nr:ZIP family metal transporter [Pyrinomonadaceae bacterium]